MSLFGNLVRLDETTRPGVDFTELPLFSYKSLVDEEEIGVGAFAIVFTRRSLLIIAIARDIYFRTAEVFGCIFHPTNLTGRFCYILGISLATADKPCACIASRKIPIIGIRYYNFENGLM